MWKLSKPQLNGASSTERQLMNKELTYQQLEIK